MKKFVCMWLTYAAGCFILGSAQTNTTSQAFNLYDEAMRVQNRWAYDTSSFEEVSVLSDSIIIGTWAGFVDYNINNDGRAYQRFDFTITKVDNGKAYAYAVSYRPQQDMSLPSVQQTQGDMILTVKGDKVILPFFMTSPTNQLLRCPGQIVMNVDYIPSVDGYWIRGQFEETSSQSGCGTSRFYGAQLGHSYQRRPTLVPKANQKTVVDSRRDNEALIGKRELTGGKTPEELGKLIFKAFKTNNAKAWIKCIHGDGTYVDWKQEEVKFQATRNEFAPQGLSDWSNTKFSRVRYQGDENLGYFTIEFTSGNDFTGAIRLTSIVKKYGDKYLVYRAGEYGNTKAAYYRK